MEKEDKILSKQDGQWCIYIHKNKINNKAYIGMTQQKPERRWQNGYGYRKTPHFWRAIEKYGWDNFEHIIWIEELSHEEAKHMEIMLIALFDTTNPACGYNICQGGESHCGVKHSEKSKQIMSEKSKNRFINKENHPMYNKHHTEESKRKMSETRLKVNLDGAISVTIGQCDKKGNTINEFFSATQASEITGISRSAIANCLCGLSNSAGGYGWKKIIR